MNELTNELTYFYPKYSKDSFTYVASNHIMQLRKQFSVFEYDESQIERLFWTRKHNIVMHPYLLFVCGATKQSYEKKSRRLRVIKSHARRLIAFDVADSDRISDIAVELLNECDCVFVPSAFCKDVLRNSGVETNVFIVPHGIRKSFYLDIDVTSCETYRMLNEIKKSHDYKFVLYFLSHSGFRKGADVVYYALKSIQSYRDDVVLVLKRNKLCDPFVNALRNLRMIEISDYLDDFELRALYEACDLTIVPSRGGGFELNALESISLAKPTIVTNYGCFNDYISYAIPVRIDRYVKLFSNNIIHVGNGANPDCEDLERKIVDVIDNYEYYSEIFDKNAYYVKKIYDWNEIGDKLNRYIRSVIR